MVRILLMPSISFLLCCMAAASTFEDSNPIRMVSDAPRSSNYFVLRVIGHIRQHTISFSHLAYKHGKQYEDVEGMKLWFQISKYHLDSIRSTNNKGLSCTLVVNQFADPTSLSEQQTIPLSRCFSLTHEDLGERRWFGRAAMAVAAGTVAFETTGAVVSTTGLDWAATRTSSLRRRRQWRGSDGAESDGCSGKK